MKTVKMSKVPGIPQEFALEDGATVGDVKAMYIDKTGEAVTGYETRVNNEVVADSFVPADEARIYLIQQIKGN